MNSRLTSLYPHALAIATAAVGQIIAFVPSWRPEAQPIISAGAIILAVGMLIFEGITRRTTVVKAVPLASGELEAAVRAELAKVFGSATSTPTAVAPVSASPAVSGPAAAPAPNQPAAQ